MDMAYTLSLFRGDDPQTPPPALERRAVMATLRGTAGTRELGPTAWRYEAGGVSVMVTLPDEDPGRELRLQIGWSTADHLAASLEFALGLAGILGARVYDRNAGVFVERERLDRLRSQGGFAPAARRRRWWRIWG